MALRQLLTASMELLSTWHLRLRVAAVTAYLLLVGFWLLVTGQISAPGIWKLIGSRFRGRYAGVLDAIGLEQGFCWLAAMPRYLPSDADSRSNLVLFEDGTPLGPAQSPHEDIRRHGCGRYSHWEAQLYFSTSDNTDPRTNGRVYRVEEVIE